MVPIKLQTVTRFLNTVDIKRVIEAKILTNICANADQCFRHRSILKSLEYSQLEHLKTDGRYLGTVISLSGRNSGALLFEEHSPLERRDQLNPRLRSDQGTLRYMVKRICKCPTLALSPAFTVVDVTSTRIHLYSPYNQFLTAVNPLSYAFQKPQYGRGMSGIAAGHPSLAPREMLLYDQASRTASAEEALLTHCLLAAELPFAAVRRLAPVVMQHLNYLPRSAMGSIISSTPGIVIVVFIGINVSPKTSPN
ncbi:unnamed protein product [Echinostoma caproni]|uniref:PAS domain-containing protein n=1 Tax=Echinostoma caproni TaxID=27848 RepID=A0A183B8S1_9TREM|nr:unnamed protein product [Echinostoma caproni]